jgi:rhodanese-related sulfurtransferase
MFNSVTSLFRRFMSSDSISISCKTLAARRGGPTDAQHKPVVIVDVREPFELKIASVKGADVYAWPMNDIAKAGTAAKRNPNTTLADSAPAPAVAEALKTGNADVVVMCHHGMRSYQVTSFLRDFGYKNTFSLDGGIEEYATTVDETVARY